jgi:hypothetical protein
VRISLCCRHRDVRVRHPLAVLRMLFFDMSDPLEGTLGSGSWCLPRTDIRLSYGRPRTKCTIKEITATTRRM